MSSHDEYPLESAEAIATAARATFLFLLVRGLVALGFGLLAVFVPASTAKGLIFVFGIFCLIDGVLGLIAAFVLRGPRWGWILFGGILGIVLGIIALRFPETIALAVLLLIAAWAMIAGAFLIAGSFSLKRLDAKGWYWSLVAGAVVLALGVLLLFNPVTGVKSMVVLLGIFALISGVALVVAAFSTRTAAKRLVTG